MTARVFLVSLLILTSCEVGGEPNPSPSTQSPEPAPLEPEIPALARLEGSYKLTFRLLSSNLTDSRNTHRAEWRFTPKCETGGACDVVLRSRSGKYTAKVVFVNGRYRFVRRLPNAFYCGSPGDIDYRVTVNREHSFSISAMKLIDGEWVATRLAGLNVDRGTRGCGFGRPLYQRYAMKGRRVQS